VPGPDRVDSAYLDQARRLAGRLSARELAADDVAGAMEALRDVAAVDADAPTTSAKPVGRASKAAVKRLVAWYMIYLAEQVNDIGFALVRLGEALAGKVAGTETRQAQLEARVAALEERVARLEPRPDEAPHTPVGPAN